MDRRMTQDAGGKMTRVSKLISTLALSVAAILILTPGSALWAQTATDPGVRGGPAGAGSFQGTLTQYEQESECPVTQTFMQTIGVPTGWVTNTNCTGSAYPVVIQSGGLGPAFNSNSCASCHSQPALGGSSPQSNPLFTVYNLLGATNSIPFFEKNPGPVLTARFPYQLNNLTQVDGFVHQLFTITGRADAPPVTSCNLPQPNFAQAGTDNDLALRQPLPMFGDGYIEIIQNVDIIDNLNANLSLKQSLGIGGVAQITDDGSVSRLGWKAQWRAILPAVGAEENIEMGLTNEMFPTETNQSVSNCLTNGVPEDVSNYTYWSTNVGAWNFDANASRNAIFARFLQQPTPACSIASLEQDQNCSSCPAGGNCATGYNQFNAIGCNLCHTQSFETPAGSIPSMGHITANLFSDLLLHHMGPCLADNVVQGAAQGDMFRTPPLWNVGQRYYFMHDGRTSNIVTAIEEHSNLVTTCTGNSQYPASEANAVVTAFNNLSTTNQQDLIDFLRSL